MAPASRHLRFTGVRREPLGLKRVPVPARNPLPRHGPIGDRVAAVYLAELLGGHGDLDRLRAEVDADDRWFAIMQMGDLRAKRGDLDELRTRADTRRQGRRRAAARPAKAGQPRGSRATASIWPKPRRVNRMCVRAPRRRVLAQVCPRSPG
jgi:hypothetical protein